MLQAAHVKKLDTLDVVQAVEELLDLVVVALVVLDHNGGFEGLEAECERLGFALLQLREGRHEVLQRGLELVEVNFRAIGHDAVFQENFTHRDHPGRCPVGLPTRTPYFTVAAKYRRTCAASMRWAALLLVFALAGCFGSVDQEPAPEPTQQPVRDPDWAVRAIPLDHDHTDRSLHMGLSSPNWQVVGRDQLATDYHGAPSGGYYCGEVSSGETKLAVVNSFTSNTAIVIMDVTDPANPMKVGELILENAHVYDSAITDDGQYAILATSPLDALFSDPNDPAVATYDITPRFRTACGESQGPTDSVPYASGTVLVDLRDPAAPNVADYKPRPAIGPHSVSSTTIDGTRWVLASTTNLAYDASTFSFFTVEETLNVPRLQEYGEYRADYHQDATADPQDRAATAGLLNGHVDGTIMKHPGTGDVMAYLANWDSGLLLVRLDGPQQINLVGRWGERDPAAGSGMTGAIHTALPMPELWHGQSVVVTGQEVGARPANRPTGQIVILNVDDPAAPTPIARWTLPMDIQWSGGLIFSTHYVALQDDILYTALYHGGVWAADASPEHWPELPSVGAYLPDDVQTEAATGGPTPEVLDVLALGSGNVLIFDATTGAYVLKLDPDGVAPAAPWLEDAWIGME